MTSLHSRSKTSLGRLLAGRPLSAGVLLTVALQFGSAVVTFAMYLLAARVLSVTDFGRLAMWLCVCQMGSVAAVLGQELFILRALNEYAVLKRPDLAKGALLFSISIVALVPLSLAVLIGTVGVLWLGETPRLMVATGLFLVSQAAISLFSHIGRSTVGILLAEGMRDFFWRSAVIVVLLVLTSTRTVIDIETYFLLSVAGIAVTLLIQVTAIARQIPRDVLQARPSWDLGTWARMSCGFWASSILETVNQFFDVVIVYWFLAPGPAGAYFVASRLANMFLVPLGALHSYTIRSVPALYFGRRFDDLSRVLRQMAEVMLVCVATGAAVLVLDAGPVLGLFGAQFTAQKWTLITLAAGTALYAAGGPASSLLMIAGHQSRYPWIVAGNIALRFLGFVVLIPMLGLEGAALAAAGSLVAVTVTLNVLCRGWLRLDPSLLILLGRRSRPTAGLPEPSFEPRGTFDAPR